MSKQLKLSKDELEMVRYDRRITHLADYCRWLRDLMNLKEWTLMVHPDPLPPDDPIGDGRGPCGAVTNFEHAQLNATIQFMDGFCDRDDDFIRQVCCHEVLHLAEHRVSAVTETLGKTGAIAEAAYAVHAEQHTWQCEVMVDQLSIAFAALIKDHPRDKKFLRKIKGDAK